MAGPSNRSYDPSDGVACLNLVGLPRLMARTSGRPEIAIGLIDGPVALDHPDLAADNIREVSGKLPATCADAEDAACAHCTFIAGILLARRYQRVQLSEEADMPVTPVPQPPAADAVLVFLHGAGEIGGDPNLLRYMGRGGTSQVTYVPCEKLTASTCSVFTFRLEILGYHI